jgi:predicted P-loop ATPase
MDTAQKWLGNLKWDGVPRVDSFMPRYMGTIDATYERSVGKYLWTALAGRIMSPGCQVDMVPILVGKQGLGKTQGIKALVPNKDFYVEIRLDEPDDTIARKMRGTLVGELAELRGLRTADLDRIKAFVTRTDEKWTPKYMEFATTFSRRLVMIGTTNEDEFLVDDENRRWLPVRTVGVNVDAIMRDRDQLWAEAMEIWLAEGVQWQDAERLARSAQADYVVEDNWGPMVKTWLEDNNTGPLRIHDVLLQAVGLGPTQVNRSHELRVGKILRECGFHKTVTTVGGIRGKFWVSPKTPKNVEPELDDLLA